MNKIKNTKERCKKIRRRILNISQKVGAIHIGGSFSSVEIIDVIFNLLKRKNDTFILSKGHAGILQYTVLNLIGKISTKDYNKYCKKDGFLGVHPDYGVPGIEASTGSLGHGLGLAAGMAIADKHLKNSFYVLMSDGELQEGSIWESALFISSNNLSNVVTVIDNNNLQSSTKSTDTHPTLYPIDKKFKSFGWDAKICDGHSSEEIYNKIKNRDKSKPFALIAKTIKGFPISFMKNEPKWHYRSPNAIEYRSAIKEINSK